MTSPNDPRVMAAINVAMKAMYSKLGTVEGIGAGQQSACRSTPGRLGAERSRFGDTDRPV